MENEVKVKAIKNFSCNKVTKSKGQYLSQEEIDNIGEDHFNDLRNNDLIIVESEGELKNDDNSNGSANGNPNEELERLRAIALEFEIGFTEETTEEELELAIEEHKSIMDELEQ